MRFACNRRISFVFAMMLAFVSAASLPLKVQSQVFSQTRIIVTDCVVEDGALVAGNTSTVTVRLKNTSSQWPVLGVLITGGWVDANSPVEFEVTNQAFVGTIEPGEESTAYFSVRTYDVDLSSLESVQCSLHISFTEGGSNESVNNVIVQLPVHKEETAEPDPLESEQEELPVEQTVEYARIQNVSRPRVYGFFAGFGICGLASVILIHRRRRGG